MHHLLITNMVGYVCVQANIWLGRVCIQNTSRARLQVRELSIKSLEHSRLLSPQLTFQSPYRDVYFVLLPFFLLEKKCLTHFEGEKLIQLVKDCMSKHQTQGTGAVTFIPRPDDVDRVAPGWTRGKILRCQAGHGATFRIPATCTQPPMPR